MAAKDKYLDRFTVLQRIQHWVLTLSFGLLALTGMPQRYALSGWAQWLISVFGGIESTRIIHRWAAIVLGALAFIHIVELGYKLFVLRLPATMLPGIKDVLHAYQVIRYNLGLTKEYPQLPRYNFAEKLEYWAVVWGTVIMGITGFMLWNPIATTRALPGQFVPAAKIAHSMEALLAVLAIFIWHVYSVHLKTWNWSMFNGKLSRKQMEQEHGAELAEIETGKRALMPERATLRKRQTIFWPIAAVFLAGAAAFLYFFATYEQTAIATVPPAETAPAVVLATSTPTPKLVAAPTRTPAPAASPTGKPASIPQVTHPLTGNVDCWTCHGPETVSPVNPLHPEYDVKFCLVCHRTEAGGPFPAPLKHAVEGRVNCTMCHVGAQTPKSHQGVDIKNIECMICHDLDKEALAKFTVPVTAPKVTPPAKLPAPKPAGVPQMPHPEPGNTDCWTCHGPETVYPVGPLHPEYDHKLCIVCHKTEPGGPMPEPMKHAVEGRVNCNSCHAEALRPKSHQGIQISNYECLICHHVDREALAKASAPAPATPAPTSAPAQPTAAAPTGAVSFAKDILPAFTAKCVSCHGALGGLKLSDYAGLMAGGANGAAVVAGDPNKGTLVAKMKGAHPAVLDAGELQKLIDWIKAGAKND